jgi:Spy/CpxP family protein refolding chaperone
MLFSALSIFAGIYPANNASAMSMQRRNFIHRKFMMRRKMFMKIAMFNLFKLKRKLHLTKKQVRQIIAAKKREFKAFRLNAKTFKNPMFGALKSGTFNKSVFVSDLTNKVRNIAEIKADFLSKFFNILTPVQRNRFVNLMKIRIKSRIKHLEFMKKMLNRKINMMKENLAQ